jgi:DNA-binding transcriptional ArsR family regulator
MVDNIGRPPRRTRRGTRAPQRGQAGLDRVFAAVADPTRRAILTRLRRGPATIGDIARPFPVSLNAVSKHVKVLEDAGLVRRRVVGRRHYCAVEPRALDGAAAWLTRYRAFWTERLDALERHLLKQRRSR